MVGPDSEFTLVSWWRSEPPNQLKTRYTSPTLVGSDYLDIVHLFNAPGIRVHKSAEVKYKGQSTIAAVLVGCGFVACSQTKQKERVQYFVKGTF